MTIEWIPVATLGKRNLLSRVRQTPSGVYLDGGELGEILLPGGYLTSENRYQDEFDVFIYRDSEDRLVATTQKPYAMLGEFGYLTVKHVNPKMGAFLDWGLPKDLLLPFAQQARDLGPGDRVIVAVCIDPNTDRLIASARIVDHLCKEHPCYKPGDAVQLMVVGESPLGYSAIVDNCHMGLLYRTELSAPMSTGQRVKGFVRQVREDGKIDLGLDPAGYGRVAGLAEQILDELVKGGGRLNYDDDSTPDEIRQRFNASKKAFKQAIGSLLRQRKIVLMHPGIEIAATPADESV